MKEDARPLESLEQVIEGIFVGMATVGERGQIVLPVEARRKLGFKAGDKLMVYLRLDRGQVRLMKAELVTALMKRAFSEIKDLKRLVGAVRRKPAAGEVVPQKRKRRGK